MELRILSYNIHGGVGTSGEVDDDAILEVIQASRSHLVALQEVRTGKAEKENFLRKLETLNYAHVLDGPTMEVSGGQYGNVLLSRLPLIEENRIDLSMAGREPRGAIIGTFAAGPDRIEVVATHLGLGLGERRRQVAQLAACLPAWSQDRGGIVRLGLGDFNDWLPFGRTRRRLHALFGVAPRVGTFPLKWPLLALDRVFVRPAPALRTLERFTSSPAERASDHWPLLARVETAQST